MSKKICIIGLGYIGNVIIETIANNFRNELEIKAIFDIENSKVENLVDNYPTIRKMKHLTDFSDCDVIIEAAVQEVVEPIFDEIIKTKKVFLPMSIGAFISQEDLYKKYCQLSSEVKNLIVFPAGAIGGFDCIESIQNQGFEEVTLCTQKPCKAFENNEYIKTNNIKLDDENPLTIFTGNAKDAASAFPKSINVAARLSLATLGPFDTKVKIISNPNISQNIHTIDIKSKVGRYKFIFENNPSPSNPKTSWLAALSAIFELKKLVS